MNNTMKNNKSSQRIENFKKELSERLKLLEQEVDSAQERYNEELIEFANNYSDDMNSKTAQKEMNRIAKKYAKEFADHEEQMQEIEEMLIQLDEASYTDN